MRARIALGVFSASMVVIVGSGAYAGLSGDRSDAPTIAFIDGPVPADCASRPNRIGPVVIPLGKWLNLVNLTGTDASLHVADAKLLAIPRDFGASVRLAVGVHVVRLVPDCLVAVERAVAIVIHVHPANRRQGLPVGTSSTPRGPTSAASRPGPTPDTVASPTEQVIDGSRLFRLVARKTSKPANLLALVSAICVFGVTAALIRAILAQRTTSVVSR